MQRVTNDDGTRVRKFFFIFHFFFFFFLENSIIENVLSIFYFLKDKNSHLECSLIFERLRVQNTRILWQIEASVASDKINTRVYD